VVASPYQPLCVGIKIAGSSAFAGTTQQLNSFYSERHRNNHQKGACEESSIYQTLLKNHPSPASDNSITTQSLRLKISQTWKMETGFQGEGGFGSPE
jgi:hypothetical protein